MHQRFFLIGLAMFTATVTQAQMARYCDGRLTANFYSNVQSTGSRSTVTYLMQLQNQSGEGVHYTVRFIAPHIQGAQKGSAVAALGPHQLVTPKLGMQDFSNPSGTGQLSQSDMNRYTQVVCPR